MESSDALKGRVAYLVGIFIMLGIIGLGSLFAYWFFNDYDPLIVNNEPSPIFSRDIKAGDFVIIDVDYCKTVEVHRIVHVSLVSEFTRLPLPDIEGISNPGCYHVQVPFPIPKQTPTGTYHFEFKAEYDVNPFRQVNDGFISQEFFVTGENL